VTQRALNTMMTGKDTTDGLLPELTDSGADCLWGKEWTTSRPWIWGRRCSS